MTGTGQCPAHSASDPCETLNTVARIPSRGSDRRQGALVRPQDGRIPSWQGACAASPLTRAHDHDHSSSLLDPHDRDRN